MRLSTPSDTEIEYQQKQLTMYRGLLVEYLRQRDLWDRTEIPDFLSTRISMIRKHILAVKGHLHSWKIAVADHPDDEGPNDDLAAKAQHYRKLLKIYRTNLALYLRQQEQFGEGQVPPIIIRAQQNDRSEIRRIKVILRGWNIAVEDLSGEDEGHIDPSSIL